jgi:hypothetical protein
MMAGLVPGCAVLLPGPVSVPPETARADSCLTPLTAAAADQCRPSVEVQVTSCLALAGPACPAAIRVLPFAVSAVTTPRPPGAGRMTDRQWAPPSAEATASGMSPAPVTAKPVATMMFPLATT